MEASLNCLKTWVSCQFIQGVAESNYYDRSKSVLDEVIELLENAIQKSKNGIPLLVIQVCFYF